MLVKCEVNGRVTEENNVVSVSDKQNFIDLLDLDLSEFEKQFDLIESEPVKDHSQILFSLYEQIDEVDFRNEAGFKMMIRNYCRSISLLRVLRKFLKQRIRIIGSLQES